MSGNTKQRRRARRARERAGVTLPPAPAVVQYADGSRNYLTEEEVDALATPQPSRRWVAVGVVALAFIVSFFVAWIVTLPPRK